MPGSRGGGRSLGEHFEPLSFLIGKTWRGTFSTSTRDRPMHDVLTAERALNGRAIRLMHSVNEGEYGGETIVIWDTSRQCLAYHYITTAGFTSTGVIEPSTDGYRSTETVTGSETGITKIQAITTRANEQRFHVASLYLKDGSWVPGHEATYELAPGAEVVFR